MRIILIGLVICLSLCAYTAFAGGRGVRAGQSIAGDTNCDGRVLATDALATLRIVTGIDDAELVREVCKR